MPEGGQHPALVINSEEQVQGVRNAATFIRSREDVDPRRVGLIG
ncbi:hypothetical protein [Streptomyces sp. NPDC004629]